MKPVSPVGVLVMSIGLAACLGFAGYAATLGDGDRSGLMRAYRLEKIAEHRFEHARGLSPCDYRERDLVRAARRSLIAIGESDVHALAVVAPTFSEIEVVAFGSSRIRTYRYAGQTGFDFPSAEWVSPQPVRIADLVLTATEQQEIVSPLSRHIAYAMTARTYGIDGVSYYFGLGEDDCALAWMPRGNGPASRIVEMVRAASGGSAAVSELLSLARAIDDADEWSAIRDSISERHGSF